MDAQRSLLAPLPAAVADVELELAATVKAWADLLLYETWIDEKAWAPSVELVRAGARTGCS